MKNYDYSRTGVYFITICVQNRENLLGEIINNVMILNEFGKIIYKCLNDTCNHFPQIDLDYFVIMPNHFHGIVVIKNETEHQPNKSKLNNEIIAVGAGLPRPYNGIFCKHNESLQSWENVVSKSYKKMGAPHPKNKASSKHDQPPSTLGQIIAYFKYQSTKQINLIRNLGIRKLWQRNYYEHIIRNENELNGIRQYFSNNPVNWKSDRHYIEE